MVAPNWVICHRWEGNSSREEVYLKWNRPTGSMNWVLDHCNVVNSLLSLYALILSQQLHSGIIVYSIQDGHMCFFKIIQNLCIPIKVNCMSRCDWKSFRFWYMSLVKESTTRSVITFEALCLYVHSLLCLPFTRGRPMEPIWLPYIIIT